MSLLIAFSGQGLQDANMFKMLAEDDFGRQWLNDASQQIGLELQDKKIVAQYCHDTVYAQLFLTVLSVGSYQALIQKTGLSPQLLCGYSLGELSAYAASARLSIKELCSLSYKRAELMQQVTTEVAAGESCGLVALKGNIDLNSAQRLSTRFNCPIAIINADDHYILGGLATHLELLLNEAKSHGVRTTKRLEVNLPSHTPLLIKATDAFLSSLEHYQHYVMHIPILNSLTNELISSSKEMIPILAKELSQTLHWNKVMKLAPEYGTDIFLELGAGSSLKKMYLAENAQCRAYSLDDFATINGLSHFILKHFEKP
ncbi:acyltransferase domain-containing protein [Legionella quateirensis]|uniref:Malonyl-CoA acyl-carrier-protein transacylase n=1 Tax=Legionella quateirensis TaxID=45072 RepID=A0A378KXF3_9GAMM|nr:acyltransferase domain-containing protein [Legionella quateirensis]KTD55337.1 putative malonyl-CoA acyl-carrier-protein transacylase [Legionella quateirensis]STY16510.1 putative malonyl-CoA acyl-carrier-protein transacylase [Legionella quateirensis]